MLTINFLICTAARAVKRLISSIALFFISQF